MAKRFDPYDYVQQPDYTDLSTVERHQIQAEMAGRIQKDLDELRVLPPMVPYDPSDFNHLAQQTRIRELEGQLAKIKEAWMILSDLAEADDHA